MLLYITLGSTDLVRSQVFYDAVLATLSVTRRVTEDDELGYGSEADSRCRLWVLTPVNGRPATFGNGAMTALDAPSRAAVDAFHAAALANGGTDEGAPGLRPYHASFYACYVRDPDGNKLSAVCETP
ncbi:Glyoxalase/bleomycin resistance protein/dioxygenase [Rhizobium sp. PDO1-076]|uniref:VOC family protein n=1 Tax=Rhizobium sp. PDO1-076 TaxID=1125979 RepID=UPI00024E29E3|nr:VOC family protein [Rhizobium sp. PDO1-076]EHS49850.1 Glyoxalase/bleomycin resistance protein/dioxygenase [Rhizobium sp. PDO1-076]